MKLFQNLILTTAAISLCSCASNPFSSYKSTSDTTLHKIYSGQLPMAMEAESTSDPLYNMEYGSLLRMDQNYSQSNYYFSLAQQSMDVWANSWMSTTGGQLSNTALSMLVNDNATEYQPRGYERSFVTTYHALNHLDLNNWQNARVEIKRMYQIEQATENYNQALYNQEAQEFQKVKQDSQQNYLSTQILKKYNFTDINTPQVLALKNSYQNAFSHYLAGFVFEALNEPSLSRPGYVKAGQLNPNNTLIQQSIDNIDSNTRSKKGTTDLLIVEEIGHAPQIKSEEVHVPINLNFSASQNNQQSCINMIDVFYPRLIMDQMNTTPYAFSLDNTNYNPMLMVDVNLMVARSIRDQTPHIIARNVAAAVRNIATSQAACTAGNNGGSLGTILSLGASLGGMLLDRADERTWTLLPSKIYINRVNNLAYGEHKITVNLNGVPHIQTITLNQPYQIVTFRVIGSQIIFNLQRGSV
ncbi:MAG: hypothetical protein K2X04_02635 [Burkholderiales bacterium]|jgi:hypothetical protein|nr:hypothetical protein [Burkholderiales bacterium]